MSRCIFPGIMQRTRKWLAGHEDPDVTSLPQTVTPAVLGKSAPRRGWCIHSNITFTERLYGLKVTQTHCMAHKLSVDMYISIFLVFL